MKKTTAAPAPPRFVGPRGHGLTVAAVGRLAGQPQPQLSLIPNTQGGGPTRWWLWPPPPPRFAWSPSPVLRTGEDPDCNRKATTVTSSAPRTTSAARRP